MDTEADILLPRISNSATGGGQGGQGGGWGGGKKQPIVYLEVTTNKHSPGN